MIPAEWRESTLKTATVKANQRLALLKQESVAVNIAITLKSRLRFLSVKNRACLNEWRHRDSC